MFVAGVDRLEQKAFGRKLRKLADRGERFADRVDRSKNDAGLIGQSSIGAQRPAKHAADATDQLIARGADNGRIFGCDHDGRQCVITFPRRWIIDRRKAQPAVVAGFGATNRNRQ